MRLPLALICIALLSPVAAAAKPRPTPTPGSALVKSKEPLLRETAALILGMRGDGSAVPLLIKGLKGDSDRWVRAACAEALGLIGDARGIRPLRSALGREKQQRVRRAVAGALLRLGQREGIDELFWQLRTGTNHVKAEVMRRLVAYTGLGLGQDVEAWWKHMRRRGYADQARRPQGSPAFAPLAEAARIWGGDDVPWRQVCSVPRSAGEFPQGCLVVAKRFTQKSVRALLKKAKGVLGVAAEDQLGPAARELLQGKLIIDGLKKTDLLPDGGARLIIVDRGPGPGKESARKALVLLVLP